ncbi:MAG: 7-cyano-7-deazaguanine synthase QueC [Fusobacterium necrophorum]|nr:7-cyano-7-deazaguanine synthase QueC [Fusobacterium necrophorum]MDY6172326.1 7-cyano-7-deazaguanine synthase QueC [Fusobacterium necrophorum]
MKVLVLLSGGLDSSTCLAMAIEKYGTERVIAFSAFYGQKHNKELEAARSIANYYHVELIEVNLSKIFAYSNSSLLKHSGKEIPHCSYAEQLAERKEETLSTYVPFRNGLFLSTATSIAISKDCSIIFYGAHSDDAAGNAYPDCSPAFHEAMNTAIYEGSGRQVKVEAPFLGLHKKEIVKLGLNLKVPYELTWSCYEGGKHSCGQCGTCIDREKAFEENDNIDPLVMVRGGN